MVKDHLRKQEGVGFVAERKGQVVGFIIGEIKGEDLVWRRAGGSRWSWSIPVKWTGIGYAMPTNSSTILEKGIRDVHTSVLWDAVDMLSFFKSLGFDRSTFINLIKHVD